MKKIILGLCFTVGFSGMSFANTNLPLDAKDKSDNSEVAFVDCSYGNTFVVTYCNGSKETFYSITNGPCKEGMADGSLDVKVYKVDGCGPTESDAPTEPTNNP